MFLFSFSINVNSVVLQEDMYKNTIKEAGNLGRKLIRISWNKEGREENPRWIPWNENFVCLHIFSLMELIQFQTSAISLPSPKPPPPLPHLPSPIPIPQIHIPRALVVTQLHHYLGLTFLNIF